MPPAGFEPSIPASERPQTHVLDRAAAGIGDYVDTKYKTLRSPLLWDTKQRMAVISYRRFGAT
jgi:hypothetical protein